MITILPPQPPSISNRLQPRAITHQFPLPIPPLILTPSAYTSPAPPPKSSPRSPDVAELLHLVEELLEREFRLYTQILEHKLLKEFAAIVAFLKKEIAMRGDELSRAEEGCIRAEQWQLTTALPHLGEPATDPAVGSTRPFGATFTTSASLAAIEGIRMAASTVKRVPEVVEFYHSLMQWESRRELAGGEEVAVQGDSGGASWAEQVHRRGRASSSAALAVPWSERR
ncbi:hypothetical protein Cni_G01951 [Canna indica]|uniref:Uncharacterized protein n=1 Tax=Canna indica TaxID=4628 RepID=A0AAQ3JP55_9LILI|nr:hypothetical protein Cni_G01951 [Canna indica]